MEQQIKEKITEEITEALSPKRLKHVRNVAGLARRLAKCYQIDPDKAELAALFHDMCKSMDLGALNALAKEAGLPSRYQNNSNLAHGKTARYRMQRDYGITDPDLLNAVSFHTTGRAGMSTLEKIIYIADAAEPGRQYPGVEEIRTLLFTNLDEACVRSLSLTVRFVRAKGQYLDPDTLQALEYLTGKQDKDNRNTCGKGENDD